MRPWDVEAGSGAATVLARTPVGPPVTTQRDPSNVKISGPEGLSRPEDVWRDLCGWCGDALATECRAHGWALLLW